MLKVSILLWIENLCVRAVFRHDKSYYNSYYTVVKSIDVFSSRAFFLFFFLYFFSFNSFFVLFFVKSKNKDISVFLLLFLGIYFLSLIFSNKLTHPINGIYFYISYDKYALNVWTSISSLSASRILICCISKRFV